MSHQRPLEHRVSSGIGLNLTDPKASITPATASTMQVSSNVSPNFVSNSTHLGTSTSSLPCSPSLQCCSSPPSMNNGPNPSFVHQKKPPIIHRKSSHHALAEILHKTGEILKSASHHGSHTSSPHSSSPYASPSVSRNSSTTSLNKILESFQRPSLTTRNSNASLVRCPSKDNFGIFNKSNKNISSSNTNLTKLETGHLNRPPSSNGSTASASASKSSGKSTVKETHYVHVEYNPVTRKRVLNTYEILKDLGSGQHGKVKLARGMDTNEFVAIKIVDRCSKPRLGRISRHGSTQEDKIRREIAIMKKCSHPHVVKLIEVLDAENSRKIYMVLEYLEKGEIHWQKKVDGDNQPEPMLTLLETKTVFRDVVSGLEYLHHQGIIHRDIKPSNLLVSKDNVVKISDFGVSFAANSEGNNEFELAKTAGTPAFLAPELCKTDGSEVKVTYKIDLWALGVTLFCLVFGVLPFNGGTEFALFDAINNDALKYPDTSLWKSSPPLNQRDLDQVTDLIDKLLQKDPYQRIEINDIKEHPFFMEGLTRTQSKKYTSNWNSEMKIDVTNKEVAEAVAGIGNRLRKKLSDVFKMTGLTSPKPSGTLVKTHPTHKQSHTETSTPNLPVVDETGDKNILSNLSLDRLDSAHTHSASALPRALSTSSKSELQFFHRGSISASIDSATTESSNSLSISETKENIEADFSVPDRAEESAVTQLISLINKDKDLSAIPVNESEVTLTTENKPTKANSTFLYTKEELAKLPDNSDNHTPTMIATPSPKSPYDFREELSRSEYNKSVNLPLVPSFASLDSYYDECNAEAQRYIGSSAAQRSNLYSQTSGRTLSHPASYKYAPSVDSANSKSARSNGPSFKETNFNPLNSSMPSAVSIPDFLRPSEIDPITPSVSNDYYTSVTNNRRLPAHANNFKKEELQSAPQPLITDPSTDQTIMSKRRDSRKVVFLNESDNSSSEDDGPITFAHRRVNTNAAKLRSSPQPPAPPSQASNSETTSPAQLLHPNDRTSTKVGAKTTLVTPNQRHQIYGKRLISSDNNDYQFDNESDSESNSETELMLSFGGSSSRSDIGRSDRALLPSAVSNSTNRKPRAMPSGAVYNVSGDYDSLVHEVPANLEYRDGADFGKAGIAVPDVAALQIKDNK